MIAYFISYVILKLMKTPTESSKFYSPHSIYKSPTPTQGVNEKSCDSFWHTTHDKTIFKLQFNPNSIRYQVETKRFLLAEEPVEEYAEFS